MRKYRRSLRKQVLELLRPLDGWTGFSIKCGKRRGAHIRIYLADPESAPQIPKRIAGATVKVERMSVFRPPPRHLEPAVTHAMFEAGATPDPLRAGVPVSARSHGPSPGVGSVGAFIKGTDNLRWLLSVNHAIAGNGEFLDFDPLNENHGIFAGNAARRVGRTVKFVPIEDEGRADAAICQLDPEVVLADVLHADAPVLSADFGVAKLGATVHFRASSGEVRTATITDENGEFGVRMNLPGLGLVRFPGHVVIEGNEGLIEETDSGSLAILHTNTGMKPLGLIVGFPEVENEARRALVCPLSVIFKQPEIRDPIGGITSILVP